MLSFLSQNHEIGHYSGYQTRVFADYFYELTDISDLSKLAPIYQFTLSEGLPFLIIGGGTNLLFASDCFSGVVIKNSLSGWNYDSETKILKISSNESIWDIASTLEIEYNQSLWHRFIGLPGSVGGAVYGNAGCFGLETESNFVSCEIYDMLSGEQRILSRAEMGFAYRYSILKENPHWFLISATFDLSQKIEKYHSDVDNIDFRENKQPKGNCCGSFFKNPKPPCEGGKSEAKGGFASAGSLIESVGLKGYRHGGAYWSDLHANFLMSNGPSCLPSDLIELVRLTQETVKRERGIELENEVRIIQNSKGKIQN